MLLKVLLVGLFVVGTTVQVVRTAAVESWAEAAPATAAMIWPQHPDVQRTIAMAEVGAAAAGLKDPPQTTLLRLQRLASAAPLALEPFLVQAAIARKSDDHGAAEQLLAHARDRDPRSAAARFLLADLYFRTGRVNEGLAEMAVFSRFVPGAVQQFGPALAQYATTPGAFPEVKRIIALYPELEAPLLAQLAQDTRNTDLILALATPPDAGAEAAGWKQTLLGQLIEEGAYRRAYAIWARLSQVPPGAARGLFNPRFNQSNAPAPFNWALTETGDGVAEPTTDGLHVLYFGRRDLVLASQLMLLRPGRYKLEMNIAGRTGDDGQLAWIVTCLPSNRQAMQLPIAGGAGGAATGDFEVGGEGCVAQRIELRGIAQEFAETAELRISELRLARSGR